MSEFDNKVEVLKDIETKAENLVRALTKNYIADGYSFLSYENNDNLGYIEVYLRNNKNEIRITSLIIDKEVIVYKNRKVNNKIKISA